MFEFGAKFAVLAITEACNRACSHCANVALPHLQSISFDNLKKWVNLVGTTRTVGITFGEPFTHPNLFDISSFLLSLPNFPSILIHTSGIDFESSTEHNSAMRFGSLKWHEKSRIIFNVTLSGYPNMRYSGETSVRAANEMQLDTIAFLLSSGFRVGIPTFYSIERTRKEFFPQIEKRLSASFTIRKARRLAACLYCAEYRPILLGRMVKESSAENSASPKYADISTFNSERGCTANGGKSLMLLPNGGVGVSCCNFLTIAYSFANMNEIHSRKELETKLREFSSRARKGQTLGYGACLSCAASANLGARFGKMAGEKNCQKIIEVAGKIRAAN